MSKCPCLSGNELKLCCGPALDGSRPAATAEALMRSRYVAFTRNDMAYVERTTHPSSRAEFDRKTSEEWASQSEWLGLEIIKTEAGGASDDEGTVEFVANYKVADQTIRHHELSQFKKEAGEWFFVDGKTMQKPVVNSAPKVGRNDPCPCGSGKKFKKCCGDERASV